MKKYLSQTLVIIVIIIIGCIILLGFACVILDYYFPGFPQDSIAPEEFPETEIIFQGFADLERIFQVGFVNSDGSGEEYLPIRVINNWFGESPPFYPVITQDNTTMIFRMGGHRYPGELVVFSAGKKLSLCEVEIGTGRPQLINNDQQVFIELINSHDRYAIFDLDACETGMEDNDLILYDGNDFWFPPVSASLSPDGQKLAYYAWLENSDLPAIFVYDIQTKNEILITQGILPAWSPDGNWLAYTGPDGINIIRTDGTEERLLVEYKNPEKGGRYPFEGDWPPLLSWSPDGNWLVYHKCILPVAKITRCSYQDDYAIFKVNVNTGEETKIIDGGLNPYWRVQETSP